jgi:hypothetical protein
MQRMMSELRAESAVTVSTAVLQADLALQAFARAWLSVPAAEGPAQHC